ncbi:unnamed protein product [Enterobius vermicularis]|uniref:Mucin-22-like n=1 Tax=Enterobius vermicularis TaxID=51028 RepID=A0A0N4VDJ9_ENTVE|nr:unnamed protein product [Enterobius vermicularis]
METSFLIFCFYLLLGYSQEFPTSTPLVELVVPIQKETQLGPHSSSEIFADDPATVAEQINSAVHRSDRKKRDVDDGNEQENSKAEEIPTVPVLSATTPNLDGQTKTYGGAENAAQGEGLIPAASNPDEQASATAKTYGSDETRDREAEVIPTDASSISGGSTAYHSRMPIDPEAAAIPTAPNPDSGTSTTTQTNDNDENTGQESDIISTVTPSGSGGSTTYRDETPAIPEATGMPTALNADSQTSAITKTYNGDGNVGNESSGAQINQETAGIPTSLSPDSGRATAYSSEVPTDLEGTAMLTVSNPDGHTSITEQMYDGKESVGRGQRQREWKSGNEKGTAAAASRAERSEALLRRRNVSSH